MRTCCSAAVLPAALLLIAVNSSAQSFVVPPASLPGGLSYEQWSAKWGQWALLAPANMSPILDKTGVDCAINQSGQVWFLAGTSGFNATRSCVIPAGRMIFFPVLNQLNDCPCPADPKLPPFAPGPGQSLEQFLTVGYRPYPGARQFLDHTTQLDAKLDGVAVQGLVLPPLNSTYRATSPMFSFTADSSWVGQGFDACITGSAQPAVSDGYWIMLAPLSPGNHTLRFRGDQLFHEPRAFHQQSPPGRFSNRRNLQQHDHLTPSVTSCTGRRTAARIR